MNLITHKKPGNINSIKSSSFLFCYPKKNSNQIGLAGSENNGLKRGLCEHGTEIDQSSLVN